MTDRSSKRVGRAAERLNTFKKACVLQDQISYENNKSEGKRLAVIDKYTCIRCGSCEAVCPVQAIVGYRDFYSVKKYMCIGCSVCLSVCPVDAIKMIGESDSTQLSPNGKREANSVSYSGVRSDILDRLRKIIADSLFIEEREVTLDSRVSKDLGADSLDAVELIMTVEREFNIFIPDSAAQEISTVGDIVAYIQKHI